MLIVAFISLFLWVFLLQLPATEATDFVSPHIVFILADDLGWNDISYHGSPEIPTPNIDALASSSIRLESYYSEIACTPNRGSLLSGRYSLFLGLQHLVIVAGVPTGLPLNITTLPQHLKRLGYSTHMVGKWHLGYHRKEYTPTYRGFDSFFGFYNGNIDYYDYTHHAEVELPEAPIFWGTDLHNGTTHIRNFRGQYSTDVFTEAAENIIDNHDTSKPLFLYLAYSAVHVGNSYMPQQSPPETMQKFGYIKDYSRRAQAGMTAKLDEGVGRVFAKLHEKCMLDNSIVVFVSDNGGETYMARNGRSTNYPLRGQKLNVFEGGVRVPSLIWSPIFQLKEPRIYNHLMHVSDWLPTLYRAAGGDVNDLQTIDGFNMWESLLTNSPSPRTYVLHNIDTIYGMSGLRIGNFKLVNGSSPDNANEWYGPTGFEYIGKPQSMDGWVFKNGSIVRDILKNGGWWLVKNPDTWRMQVVNCEPPPEGNGGCNVTEKPCLFNIATDPCEHHDIADFDHEKVDDMMRIVHLFEAGLVPPVTEVDEKADPACHGFAYVPWKDPEFASQSCSHG